MHRIKVLLADDQVLFVESLKTVLEVDDEGLSVVGVAYDGLQVLELVRKTEPDVVLLDVRMPKLDGVEAVRPIMRARPQTKIIMLTTFDDDEYVQRALHYGASGYLLKNIPPHKLIAAIRGVVSGSVLIAPGLARRILAHPRGEDEASDQADAQLSAVHDLTPREREILILMMRGYGNRQIVEQLSLAEQTVRNHVSMIYSKLGVRDRYEAVQVAARAGMG